MPPEGALHLLRRGAVEEVSNLWNIIWSPFPGVNLSYRFGSPRICICYSAEADPRCVREKERGKWKEGIGASQYLPHSTHYTTLPHSCLSCPVLPTVCPHFWLNGSGRGSGLWWEAVVVGKWPLAPSTQSQALKKAYCIADKVEEKPV